MRWSLLAAAALVGAAFSASPAAFAQGAGVAPGAASPAPRATRQKREPTAGQMAARERQRKCGVEWRDAKAKGSTGGLKWPQYWSKCNARLKGNTA